MKHIKYISQMDEGNAVVMVMFILSILTVMGFAAMNTSTTELLVAGNDLVYRRNFYKAEEKVVHTIHNIEAADPETLRKWGEDWLIPYTDVDSDPLVAIKKKRNLDNWKQKDADPGGEAMDMGIANGSSMVMTNRSHVRAYAAFGYYHSHNGKILIETGYKKRF